MPNPGDNYRITLIQSHLGWGDHRHTDTRNLIQGEGYIPIPRYYAVGYNICNSSSADNPIYRCTSTDGYFNGYLLAQGCSHRGDIYAKQFAELGDLKGIGRWYSGNHAMPGDEVSVTFTSAHDIEIEFSSNH